MPRARRRSRVSLSGSYPGSCAGAGAPPRIRPRVSVGGGGSSGRSGNAFFLPSVALLLSAGAAAAAAAALLVPLALLQPALAAGGGGPYSGAGRNSATAACGVGCTEGACVRAVDPTPYFGGYYGPGTPDTVFPHKGYRLEAACLSCRNGCYFLATRPNSYITYCGETLFCCLVLLRRRFFPSFCRLRRPPFFFPVESVSAAHPLAQAHPLSRLCSDTSPRNNATNPTYKKKHKKRVQARLRHRARRPRHALRGPRQEASAPAPGSRNWTRPRLGRHLSCAQRLVRPGPPDRLPPLPRRLVPAARRVRVCRVPAVRAGLDHARAGRAGQLRQRGDAAALVNRFRWARVSRVRLGVVRRRVSAARASRGATTRGQRPGMAGQLCQRGDAAASI